MLPAASVRPSLFCLRPKAATGASCLPLRQPKHTPTDQEPYRNTRTLALQYPSKFFTVQAQSQHTIQATPTQLKTTSSPVSACHQTLPRLISSMQEQTTTSHPQSMLFCLRPRPRSSIQMILSQSTLAAFSTYLSRAYALDVRGDAAMTNVQYR